MTIQATRLTLFILLFLCAFITACRIPKNDIPGEYYLVSSDGEESLALNLQEDGSYTLYRSFYSDPHESGRVQIAGDPDKIYERTGSGTWEVLNETILGPGDEAVQFKGSGGEYSYQDDLSTVRKDGRVCLYTSGRKEYWCKKK